MTTSIMREKRAKSGFILPMSVCFLLVISISLGAVFSYVSFAMRTFAQASTETICRLSAQSGLEDAKQKILTQFRQFYQEKRNDLFNDTISRFFSTVTDNAIVIGCSPYTVSFAKDATINGCDVQIRVYSAEQSTQDDTSLVRNITLRSKATCRDVFGRQVSRTIEETVAYELKQSEVFNYAYFINNLGWFQGNGGTANGDIRANGDLQLDGGCYVNGAMYAMGAFSRLTGNHASAFQYLAAANGRMRPLASYANDATTATDDATWIQGYNPNLYTTGNCGYANCAELEMPYLGNLDNYKKLANGTISQGSEMCIDQVYSFSQPGPSGIPALADAGCILLEGTYTNPIVLSGTVVVDGDVLIKGYVTGQGAIYAGRNIHLLGNVYYKNPPTWSTSSQLTSSELDAQAVANASKDILVLAAKGNIVLGNYTKSDWLTSVKSYITTPFVKPYTCDASDATIGYPLEFNGNYTATDGGAQVVQTTQKSITGYDKRGRPTYQTTTVLSDATTRKYYESAVGNTLVNEKADTCITQIDALLYNNHAIMGNIGSCNFNGGVVSRDEGIIYDGSVKFNWDIRLGSRSRDNQALRNRGINVNHIVQLPLVPGEPRLISWAEVLK